MEDDTQAPLKLALPIPDLVHSVDATARHWADGLETERLKLVAPGRVHFDHWVDLHGNAQVARYIHGDALSPEDCWRNLANVIGHITLRGYSMWAVHDKASNEFLGRIGPWQPEGWPGLELGWAFLPNAQGRGYATEAGQAALTWCRNAFGPGAMTHCIKPGNTASIKLAQRLGAQHLGDAEVSGAVSQIWVTRL